MDGPEISGTALLTFNKLRLWATFNNGIHLLFGPDMLWRWACGLNVTHCITNVDSEKLSIGPMPMYGHGFVNLGLQF